MQKVSEICLKNVFINGLFFELCGRFGEAFRKLGDSFNPVEFVYVFANAPQWKCLILFITIYADTQQCFLRVSYFSMIFLSSEKSF